MATEGLAPERRVFGDGPSRLRPNFIQPYRCTNVLIEDVTIVNSRVGSPSGALYERDRPRREHQKPAGGCTRRSKTS
jgi:hypothetical protein